LELGLGNEDGGWRTILMNSSERLGPLTSVFTLVPMGIDNLDLLTGNGFLSIPSPVKLRKIHAYHPEAILLQEFNDKISIIADTHE
jgi:hypothetical protein